MDHISDPNPEMNISVIIPMIENAIEQEKAIRDANFFIKNETGFLESDFKITQAKILLSRLRRGDSFQ